MLQISATELRKNLFEYLEKVGRGETIQIKLHGRVIGSLSPEATHAEKALLRLRELGKTAVIGDVESSCENEWTADERNL